MLNFRRRQLSQRTAGTTGQSQEMDTKPDEPSSGVSETKFLYSQAERLLAFSVEVWFQDKELPGRHIMKTALKKGRKATGTTPTSRHAPEPDFARSKPYPSVELIDSIVTCTEYYSDDEIWLLNQLTLMDIRDGTEQRLEIHSRFTVCNFSHNFGGSVAGAPQWTSQRTFTKPIYSLGQLRSVVLHWH